MQYKTSAEKEADNGEKIFKDFNNFTNMKIKTLFSNVQKITSAIFLLQFMFRSIAKNLTKEPCKDVVFILMCSMYFIT